MGDLESVYKTMGISETGDPLATVRNIVSIFQSGLFEGCGFREMEQKTISGQERKRESRK